MSDNTLYGKAAISAGIKAGNINISGAMKVEVMELSAESKEAQQEHAKLLRQFEATKRARTIVVPTNVDEIKRQLRGMNHPVTLFGEGPMDRRDRLREILAAMELSDEELSKVQAFLSDPNGAGAIGGKMPQTVGKGQKESTFYSPANEELVVARENISKYSFNRAQKRLTLMKSLRSSVEEQSKADASLPELYSYHSELMLNMSQFARTTSDSDSRPLSCMKYSPNGRYIGTGSLSCLINIYEENGLEWKQTLRGHAERVTSLSWYPSMTSSILGSSSADNTCILWDCNKACGGISCTSSGDSNAMEVSDGCAEDQPILCTLKGHQGIVSACQFHPSGDYIATTSHDFTWRLWDVKGSNPRELLLQDGHNKEVSALSWHPDGALLATGDSVGNILLWDTRSGQMIQSFQGHIKKISKLDFHPTNGFELASGSVDHMIRIWDLRMRKLGTSLPAHSNCISHVGYSTSGELLITSSYDGDIKVWRTRDNVLLRTVSSSSGNQNKFTSARHQTIGMTGNNAGKVMGCDVHPVSERHIVSVSYDRSIKLWANKSEY